MSFSAAHITPGFPNRLKGIDGSGDKFGGEDPEDDSGVMRFVRIWHAGRAASESACADDRSGLTLAGVGNRTVISHIEVAFSLDDAFELVGGTVNFDHVSLLFPGDDGVDANAGYRGNGQFIFVLLGSEGDRGLELDGSAAGRPSRPTRRSCAAASCPPARRRRRSTCPRRRVPVHLPERALRDRRPVRLGHAVRQHQAHRLFVDRCTHPNLFSVTVIGVGDGDACGDETATLMSTLNGTAGEYGNLVLAHAHGASARVDSCRLSGIVQTRGASDPIAVDELYFSTANQVSPSPCTNRAGPFSCDDANGGGGGSGSGAAAADAGAALNTTSAALAMWAKDERHRVCIETGIDCVHVERAVGVEPECSAAVEPPPLGFEPVQCNGAFGAPGAEHNWLRGWSLLYDSDVNARRPRAAAARGRPTATSSARWSTRSALTSSLYVAYAASLLTCLLARHVKRAFSTNKDAERHSERRAAPQGHADRCWAHAPSG